MTTTKTRTTSTSDSLGLLLRDLDQHPMPDHERQIALAKRVAAGDEEARREMVAANLRLVVHWARRYQDRGVEMADLVQEGTFGLLRAVEKFDWERGFRFSTYATWWIRQALQRAVQQHGRTIRIPLEVGERLQRLDATTAELAGRLGRPPTDEELTEATGMTLAERQSLEDVARVAASLDQPAAADSATTLGDLVAPDDEDWAGVGRPGDGPRPGARGGGPPPGHPARRAAAALRLRRRLAGVPAGHGRAAGHRGAAGAPGRGGGAWPPSRPTPTCSAPTWPPDRPRRGRRRPAPPGRRGAGRRTDSRSRWPGGRSRARRRGGTACRVRAASRPPAPGRRSGRRPPPGGRWPPGARGSGGSDRSRG